MFGLVFSGRVFSGRVFSGRVFSGLVFSGRVFSGRVFSGRVFSGLAFSGLAFSGLAFSGLAFSGLAFSGLVGCSFTVDTARTQCASDADCSSLPAGTCIEGLCAVREGWSCLHEEVVSTSSDMVASIPLDGWSGDVDFSGRGASAGVDESASGDSSSMGGLDAEASSTAGDAPAAGAAAEDDESRSDADAEQGPVGASVAGAASNDAAIRLCSAWDIACSSPVESRRLSMAELQRDSALTFALPQGFEGYAELQAPGHVPLLYFLQPPFGEEAQLPVATLMTRGGVDRFAQALQVDLSPERGSALLVARDCVGQGSSGLRYEVSEADARAVRFYLAGGVPTTGAIQTDASGRGGFVNLPAGAFFVTASFAEAVPAVVKQGIFIRPGWISYARLTPRGPQRSAERASEEEG